MYKVKICGFKFIRLEICLLNLRSSPQKTQAKAAAKPGKFPCLHIKSNNFRLSALHRRLVCDRLDGIYMILKDKNENFKSYFRGGIGGLLSKLGRFTAKRLE